MTFENFCVLNNKIKETHKNPFTIRDVDFEHNLLMVKDTKGYQYSYPLDTIIFNIVKVQQICVTNPSRLKGWKGFEQ